MLEFPVFQLVITTAPVFIIEWFSSSAASEKAEPMRSSFLTSKVPSGYEHQEDSGMSGSFILKGPGPAVYLNI